MEVVDGVFSEDVADVLDIRGGLEVVEVGFEACEEELVIFWLFKLEVIDACV